MQEVAKAAPTRDEVAEKLRGLIDGHLSREEIAEWASTWVRMRDPLVSDPRVWNALTEMAGADLISLDRPYLYDKIDFEVWLNDLFQ